jgi:hypothetical protein
VLELEAGEDGPEGLVAAPAVLLDELMGLILDR